MGKKTKVGASARATPKTLAQRLADLEAKRKRLETQQKIQELKKSLKG